jgi:hypothetical protein
VKIEFMSAHTALSFKGFKQMCITIFWSRDTHNSNFSYTVVEEVVAKAAATTAANVV